MSQKQYADKHEEPMYCNRMGCMNPPEEKLKVLFRSKETGQESEEDVWLCRWCIKEQKRREEERE